MESLKLLLGRVLPFPYDLGFHSSRLYFFLRKSERFSRDNLEAFQLKKLKETINYASEYVPYYKEIFHALGIKAENIR
ncbi:MAG: hypothetical protein ACPL6C_02115, partial [bacterium]